LCKLQSAKADPDVWLTTLEDLRTQLLNTTGSNLSEEDLLEHALNSLPKEYEIVVSKLEDRLGASIDPLTIVELRDALNLKYERIKETKNFVKDDEDSEIALYGGGFKGKCNNCGKIGHKSADCRDKKNNNKKDKTGGKKKFDGECFYCKKSGHRASDCFKKKRDEKENNGEKANTAQDDGEVGFVMVDDYCSIIDEVNFMMIEGTEDQEKQGPAEEPEDPRMLNKFDQFNMHLGMTLYSWRFFPDPENTRPEDPEKDWSFGDHYDHPTGWQFARMRYNEDLKAWKVAQYRLLQQMTAEQLAVWKSRYKINKERLILEYNGNSTEAIAFGDDELGLPSFDTNEYLDMKNLFIGDSGASCHMSNSDEGMFDFINITEKITIGNGKSIDAYKLGKKRGKVKNIDGSFTNIVLHNVKFVRGARPLQSFQYNSCFVKWLVAGQQRKIDQFDKRRFCVEVQQIPQDQDWLCCGDRYLSLD
jgi:hypothetical protein